MSTLHLTYVDSQRRAFVMRAVRAALEAAGYEGDALGEAEKAVYSVLNGRGPYGLVQGSSEVVDEAARAFSMALRFGPDAGAVEVDLPVEAAADGPEPAEAPSIDAAFSPAAMPDDFTPSTEARRTAMALMAMADGSAQTAWFYAKMLARNTGSPDLWVEVGRVIGDAFTFQS